MNHDTSGSHSHGAAVDIAPLTTPDAVDRRRPIAATALAPVLFVVVASAAGGWTAAPVGWVVAVALTAVVGAAVLSTYLPRRGQRVSAAVGCAPCAAMPAMSVAGAVALAASAPHSVPLAVLALALVSAGLARRLGTAGDACPTP